MTCLGLAAILTLLAYALFKGVIDLLNLIPKVNIGTAWLEGVKQAIWHALGVAFRGLDAALGWQIHNLARLTNWLWREFKSHALLIAAIATPLGLLLTAYHALKALVHHLTRNSTAHTKQLTRVEHRLHVLERRIEALQDQLAAGIGEDVLPRLKALEREAHTIRTKTIPAIQAADAQAEAAISDLWAWVHANVIPIGTTTFAGAVAVALSRLGLGGLRCPGFLNLLKNRGCGLGGLLDALLGLAISALALENVCTLLPILETAFGGVVGPVTHLLTEVPLGGCEKPPKGWATLSVAVGPLPPPQTLGTFPV